MTERFPKWREGAAGALLAMAFVGLGIRLALLHLGPNERLRNRVSATRRVEQELQVGRGRIFDCNGQVLAMDLTVNDVCVDPSAILKEGYQHFIARQLSRLLSLEPAVVLQRIDRPGRQFEYIRRGVPDDEIRPVQALRIPSRMVWFEPISQRHYPQGALGCHVIGFTNLEGLGSAGVEQVHHDYLRGMPGLRISEQDGRGRERLDRRSLEVQGRQGADVHLTIDSRLQEMVEAELDRAMASTRAAAAWAIVQRVATGEILAMVSRPAYDLNAFRSSTEESRRNRALATVYEPGSTFKVATIAAVFNEGLTTPDEIIDCEGGSWMHRGRPLRDFSPHGRIPVRDVVRKSSNIGTAKLALRMSEARMEAYLRDFGFGRPTGIDLPGEQVGIFRRHGVWDGLSQSRIAIGHAIGVTSLQVLNSVCAVANDGILMKPTVVSRIVDARGGRLAEFQPTILARPIREDTARLVLSLMADVTESGGTGTRAALPGYTIAGKTGTAEKPLPGGGYSTSLNIASFVGVLPASRPEIGIIVVIDEPKTQQTGGAVAAPVFRQIAENAVRVLNIPPDRPTPESRARRAQGGEVPRDPWTSM